jgi:hypothetical protein
MMPLFGGVVVLGLVIVFGLSAATSLLVERQRLYALADGAAIVAAESFDPARVRLVAGVIRAPLSSALVEAEVRNYLSTPGIHSLEGVVLESATTPDSRHARVELSSLWRPPLVSQFFPAALRIGVSAQAQVFIR